jgi:hypothetical protein
MVVRNINIPRKFIAGKGNIPLGLTAASRRSFLSLPHERRDQALSQMANGDPRLLPAIHLAEGAETVCTAVDA